MPAVKIAIQLKSLRLPFRQALKKAADLGAAAVEIDARGEIRPQEVTSTGMRQLKKLLDDLNLKVAAVGYHTRRGFGVMEDLERRVEGTKQAMKFAHSLGAAVVVNQIGRVPDKDDSPEWQLMQQVLHDLGLWGQHVGAWLSAETGSESGPDLAKFIHSLPQGMMGVTLDPGNLVVNGFSPLDAVEALGPDILHVHAKDGVRDLAQGRGVEVPLGRGACDFPALLGALEERNYRGWFTIERNGGDDPIYEIGQAVEYLKNV